MEVLKRYESKSKPGTYHEVRRGEDGVLYCTCWAWKRNRTCKHLNDYLHSQIETVNTETIDKSNLDQVIDRVVSSLR